MNSEEPVAVVEEAPRNGSRAGEGQLTYRYDVNEWGTADWCSVGRDGACIVVGRHLRPGRHVTLLTGEAQWNGAPAEVSGRIVWCQPTENGERYVVGLRVFDAGPRPVCLSNVFC